MIVTSYFANYRKLRAHGFEIHAISRVVPNTGINGILRTFAPEADLLRDRKAGLVSDEEYTELYCEMLETIPKCFIEKLIEDGKSCNIALCCYCGKESFCHRHILAEWLNKNYNLNIKEF